MKASKRTVSIDDRWSIRELGRLFGRDRGRIKALLANARTAGTRNGHPVFRLAEAARFLVRPNLDQELLLERLQIEVELAPIVQKQFWDARVLRQRYEADAAELWPADDVQAVFVDACERIRAKVADAQRSFEAETALTPRQRQIICERFAIASEELRKELVEVKPSALTR